MSIRVHIEAEDSYTLRAALEQLTSDYDGEVQEAHYSRSQGAAYDMDYRKDHS